MYKASLWTGWGPAAWHDRSHSNRREGGRRRAAALRLAGEVLEDRRLLEVSPGGIIEGVKYNDLNANGMRDRIPVVGQEPIVVFVVDVSGSTSSTFQGSPVGDLNGDFFSNTILDAQIAAFIALNQQLIDLGFGDVARVAVVRFDSSAASSDMDPQAPGSQSATSPAADADGNGTRDVDQALRSLVFGGATNFEAALQRALALLNELGATTENGNVIFLSDGFSNTGGSFADEAAAIRAVAGNLRAFGVGLGASLAQLQIIDPEARIFQTTDEILDVFSGGDPNIGFLEPGLAGVTIYLDLNDNGMLDPGEPTVVSEADDPNTPDVDELGRFTFTGLAPGSYIVREIVPAGFRQTEPAGPDFSILVVIDEESPAAEGLEIGNTASQDQGTASLGGFVYVDVNNNGQKDPAELGLPNVPISLFGPVTLQTTTAADGSYFFGGLPAGIYTVVETHPALFIDGIDTLGTPPRGIVLNDAFDGVTIQSGEVLESYNFGERGLLPPYLGKYLLLSNTPPPGVLAQQFTLDAGTSTFQITPTTSAVVAVQLAAAPPASGSAAGGAPGGAAQSFSGSVSSTSLAPAASLAVFDADSMLPLAVSADGEVTLRLEAGKRYTVAAQTAAPGQTLSLRQVEAGPAAAGFPDVDGDARVTPLDALRVALRMGPGGIARRALGDERIFDANGDGWLSGSDFDYLVEHLNLRAARALAGPRVGAASAGLLGEARGTLAAQIDQAFSQQAAVLAAGMSHAELAWLAMHAEAQRAATASILDGTGDTPPGPRKPR